MAKRKRPSRARVESEPPTIEILTVGWMLTVVTTLACEVGFLIARWLAAGGEGPLMLLSGLLLFAAMVIGPIGLLLMAIVWRTRRPPPPAGVAVFAAVVTAAPLVMAALKALDKPLLP